MAETEKDRKDRALETYASLARALHSLDRLLDNQSATFGLSPSQWRVLEYLLLSGPMATGELAERVMCGSSTVSVITRNLARAGLLTRRAHPSDGRKEVVQLTREGRELVEKILPKRAKVLRARMCVLGKREEEHLDRLCRKLAEGDAVRFVMEMTREDGG